MNVLVDTSVWSLVLRRRSPRGTAEERELTELVGEGRVVILGPIRQELLSGVKSDEQFRRLQEHLRAFPDHPLGHEDYEEAANCFNQCRCRGILGSNTDFLICAVGRRNDFPIFTADPDFARYAKVLGVQLHGPRRKEPG